MKIKVLSFPFPHQGSSWGPLAPRHSVSILDHQEKVTYLAKWIILKLSRAPPFLLLRVQVPLLPFTPTFKVATMADAELPPGVVMMPIPADIHVLLVFSARPLPLNFMTEVIIGLRLRYVLQSKSEVAAWQADALQFIGIMLNWLLMGILSVQ